MSDRTKLIELNKKIERLQSRIKLLEKYIQVDDYGISINVGESLIYVSENEINLISNGNLNFESNGTTVIKSNSSMNLQSSLDMWLMGSVIHIN